MKIFSKSVLLALSLLVVNTCRSFAEESQVIKLSETPTAVQQTILTASSKAKGELGDIEKVTDADEIRYDIELTTGKRTRSFSVAPDGKLLSWQVFMNEIPVPARQAIHQQVQSANAKLGDIDRVVEDGKVTFDVTMTKEGKEISFTISKEGKLLSQQVELAEAPAEVQKTIRTQATGSVIKRIDKNWDDEDNSISYEVETERGGKKVSFSVDADGKLMEDN